MLAPDICNFKFHHTHHTYDKCPSKSNSLDNLVSQHFFNHSVCAVFPNTLSLPEDISESLCFDSEYYKISSIPICEFIEYSFIEAFIKNGELTSLSIDTLLDLDDCVAITPKGVLVLSLNRDVFLSLGVDKGPAVEVVKDKSGEKFQLYINLKNTCFIPGKKNYDRVYDRFKKINLKMDFILTWEPAEEKVCPSSIAAYFHKKGHLIEECIPHKNNRIDYNVNIPTEETDPEFMFEWLGVHALGLSQFSDPAHQEFLSSYKGTDEMFNVGQVTLIQWTGLFSSRKILKLLDNIRKYINERPTVSFIGFHVQGFDDSPISWANCKNNFLNCGDNNVSFIIFPSGQANIMKTYV